VQAFTIAVASLLLGICGGWLIRKSMVTVPTSLEVAATTPPALAQNTATLPGLGATAAQPPAQELKQSADAQAAPLLEQLKADPTNPGLLTQVGNLYYDAKQYPKAIDYYERALKSQPSNTSVRTDLATAYWYTGKADVAIAQYEKSLAYDPNKPDTLFNLGIVKWQGKKDGPGAIAAWQKLLDTNPSYPNKDNVLQLIAQAKQP
jgi:tetratricopeptide (TPR) repeat protein